MAIINVFWAAFRPRSFGIPNLSAFLQVDMTLVLLLPLGIVQPNHFALWKRIASNILFVKHPAYWALILAAMFICGFIEVITIIS